MYIHLPRHGVPEIPTSFWFDAARAYRRRPILRQADTMLDLPQLDSLRQSYSIGALSNFVNRTIASVL